MDDTTLIVLALLFLIVGALYSTVGHAGASGYLAVMALCGVDALLMRPTALAINILVASIAFVQFARAGHFSWRLFWPFALVSIPAAFCGAMIVLPVRSLQIAIGVVLMATAVRMAWMALRTLANCSVAQVPTLSVAIGCGGAIGFVAGLTGTGGGIFLSPIMLILGWADTKRTAAACALFILVNSVGALGGLARGGWRPEWWLAIVAASACVGGVIGATYGSGRATPRSLNFALAMVLLVAGGKLIFV